MTTCEPRCSGGLCQVKTDTAEKWPYDWVERCGGSGLCMGTWSEGRNFLERALVESKGVPASVQVKAFVTAANLANHAKRQ